MPDKQTSGGIEALLAELRPLVAERAKLKGKLDAVDRRIEEIAGMPSQSETRPQKPRMTREEARRACGLK